jgi:hypothetical protein
MRIFIWAPLYKKATTRIAKMALAKTFISKEKKVPLFFYFSFSRELQKYVFIIHHRLNGALPFSPSYPQYSSSTRGTFKHDKNQPTENFYSFLKGCCDHANF